LIGKIIKIHSDFYYVKVEDKIIECKIREILKKEHADIFVGDNVKLSEYNTQSNQAVIKNILPRTNFIPKPSVSNIDQVIIVSSLKEPSIDYLQLNRYISNAVLYGITPVICINKCDLVKDEEEIREINNIYSPLGYEIIFTSALKNSGISSLKNCLKSKVSTLCGASGVGKSSLINSINPNLHLRTKEVSLKNSKGIHTTRHSEIINVLLDDNSFADIIDTPGFNYLKFDVILPEKVDELFAEIYDLSLHCKYNDCLHVEEEGCKVIKKIHKIHPSRYESYKAFVAEAKEYKEKLSNQGEKEETKSKTMDTKKSGKIKIVKLGTKIRDISRNNKKQKLNISTLEEAYYNNEE
jgi:ribosome biogenesis GTPase